MTMPATVTLYRPVGQKELDLIRDNGWAAFPPRLSFQPIFYPVLTEDYAQYFSHYDVQMVGSREHQEYWVPAEELTEFNANIVGKIEVLAEFRPEPKTP